MPRARLRAQDSVLHPEWVGAVSGPPREPQPDYIPHRLDPSRPITGDAGFHERADGWLLRQWIRHDACRLAACYWWGVFSLEQAREDLRGLACLADPRGARLSCKAHDIADSELEEAIAAQEAAHTASLLAMRDAALAAIRAGAGHEQAHAAAVEIARSRVPLPPVSVVQQAVEEAAIEFRRSAAFWRKRGQGQAA